MKKRVAALEGRQGEQVPDSLPPNGPAGGDLTGQFPNPQIGPAAVGSDELANDSVGSAKIQDFGVTAGNIAINAVDTQRIANGEVGTADIAATAVGSGQLQPQSVGSFALRNVIAVVGSGASVNAGAPANAEVTCPPGGQLFGGGYAWQDDEANSIITNAPSETNPNQTGIVRGMVNAGSNSLFAWATCMP